MKRIESALAEWVLRFRWPIILATLVLVVGVGSGIRFLTLNNDNRVFFSEDNPQLQMLDELENTYSKYYSAVFVIEPQNGDIFTRENMSAIEQLTKDAWLIPYSSRVNSLSNFQDIRSEGDDILIEDLISDAQNLSDEEIARIQTVALSQSELVNSVISASGHVAGISVRLLMPGESPFEVNEVADYIRGLAGEFRTNHPQIKLHLTGPAMSDEAFGIAAMKDNSTLVPLMILALILIIGICLRSFVGTLTTLLVVMMSMITGLGLAGWLGMTISAASANAPTIILSLAVADCVHILVTMFLLMRKGRSKREAISESIHTNFQPVLLTSVTTAIGFLSMNFSDAPPFRDLGNIVAMGVMSAFFFSIISLPALVSVLPVRIKPKTGSRNNGLFDKLTDFLVRRRLQVIWGTVAVLSISFIGLNRIQLHDDWMKYFAESLEIRQATDFAEDNLTGFNAIEYSLSSGRPSGITDPAYLNTVEAFADWYKQQPKVVHVSSITTTIKRLNKSMHADDPAFETIPVNRELAAQYLLLYEMSLPFGLDLNDQIDVDKSATRFVATLRHVNTDELREMDARARDWLANNAPASMQTYGSGLSILWAHISERNIHSMLGATFGALVLISLILMIALRSFRIGLLSLAPNLVPAIMAFGIWGLLVGKVGLGLSVVAAMTIGIVVDDTVHFLSKYRRGRTVLGLNSEEAVRHAFNSAGNAMLVTTIALVAGFGILALSTYKMNADMGLMTAITITLALGLDFLFLPALLMTVEGKRHEKADDRIEYATAPFVGPISIKSRCCKDS